jgi:hypothetical protein
MAMVLREAIAEILQENGGPMTAQAIYEQIIQRKLFEFNTPTPMTILRSTLRRHCEGNTYKTALRTKYFARTPDGEYRLLEEPVVQDSAYATGPPAGGGPGEMVIVPTDEDEEEAEEPAAAGPSHSEIQWRILHLGSQMGFSLWAPRADRDKTWGERRIGDVPGLLERLPLYTDPATMKTIENIDVLWLNRHAIVAGFEVEHTTSVYSGLLRMSDLSAMQPNLSIKFYLVAPDDREEKFAREIARPTFVYSLGKPLRSVCRFLPYSALVETLERLGSYVNRIRPEVLDDISELYDPASDSGEAPA